MIRFFLLLLVGLPGIAVSAGEPIRVLALGDSLTAGYGLPAEAAFPAQLERALQELGYPVQVINAGVSGDTSAGGLARLDWALADKPQLVIIELGANDALRGLPPQQTRQNLDAIISQLKQEQITVLLTGMRAPRNLGPDYYTKFDALYPQLAAQHQVAFYPFFLQDVATVDSFNQPDGLHPNPAGVERIVNGLLPTLLPLLKALSNP